MKVKQGKITLLSLIAAFITFFSLSLLNLTAATARAEGVSATFVQTDTATGAAWEGIYGKQGYVVIGNTANGYYSDMYDGNDGKTEIISTTSGIKESATISRMDFATSAWGSSNNIDAYKIYKPGTTEILTNARFHNGWDNAFRDSGVMFTLKSDDEIFVSLCVVDWNNNVSETQPITIGVFNNYKKLSQEIKNVNEYYAGSAESAPLATATVTSQTSYVTFKLAGAGDYEIIGYYDNQDTSTNSPVVPMVAGFFFDNELSQAVKYTNSINYYGQNWESSPYGKSGYIVMGETKTVYSDLYVDNASDDISAERSSSALTTVGWTNNNQNKYLTVDGKVISSYAPIIKWALCSQNWGALPDWAGAAKTRSLYKPNSTEQVNARIDNGWGERDADNNIIQSKSPGDMSYIIHREKTDTVYITLYVIDMQGADNILADLRVYRNANTNPNAAHIDVDSFYGTKLLYKQTITKTQSYVTLELNGNGDFQIVLSRHKNDEGTYAEGYGLPMITALFFDSEDPTKASINDVSLTLDGTIGLNFYTKIPGAYENAAMRFTYADGATETIQQPATLTDGYYKFTAKVLPKNYNKQVKAELMSGDTVLDTAQYSVKDYCDYVAEKSSDEKLKSLCASLVNYGAAADNYFNDAQNQITEATVTAENLKGYQATAQGSAPEGVTVNEISLIIESETSIRLYVTLPDGVTVQVNDKEAQIKTDGNKRYIEIANIAAKDLDNVYEITFDDGYTIKCSALTYVYEVLSHESDDSLKTVAKALYSYNQAANAYFA